MNSDYFLLVASWVNSVATYIIKRLLLMVLTMFGICMVSFIVINLAPGDPADKSSAPGAGGGVENKGISDKVLRDNRERLFLDKPIVFNTSPSDTDSVTEQMIKDLLSDDEYTVKDVLTKGRLNDLGTVSIHALARELEIINRNQKIRSTVRAALDKKEDFDLRYWKKIVQAYTRPYLLAEADAAALQAAIDKPTAANIPVIEKHLEAHSELKKKHRDVVLGIFKANLTSAGQTQPFSKAAAEVLKNAIETTTNFGVKEVGTFMILADPEIIFDDEGKEAKEALKETYLRDESRRKTFLKAFSKISAKWGLKKDDPRLLGTTAQRATAWVVYHHENKDTFTSSNGSKIVKEFVASWDAYWEANKSKFSKEWKDKNPVYEFAHQTDEDSVKQRNQLLEVGQYLIPDFMELYESESGNKHVLAAWAMSEISSKEWDLIIDEKEKKRFQNDWDKLVSPLLKRVATVAENSEISGIPAPLKVEDCKKKSVDAYFDAVIKAARGKGKPGKELEKTAKVAKASLDEIGTRSTYEEQQSKRALKTHERKWRNWWERREECFVKFEGAGRVSRMFTDTRFGHWFSKILVLDFGESYTTNEPVLEEIAKRFEVTFTMNMWSIFLTYLIAIPIGIFSSTHQYSIGDRVSTVLLFVLYSLPSFWVGTMMIWLLTGPPYLDWFPSYGATSDAYATMTSWEQFCDKAWHLTLPVICLTYGGVAYISRQMRAGMLETVRQDFIRTARAKGLSEPVVIFKHALRNSMIPIITLLANLLPLMIGGSVIIEQIFTIQGLGSYSFSAVLNRDYPVIMAIFTFSGFLTLLGILLSDIMYALVDPRIKY